MWFNSVRFLCFFPLVAVLFHACPHRLRWILLLVASYYFYACWDPFFLTLIAFTTLVSYLCSLRMARSATRRERLSWLWVNLVASLGVLFYFKYYDFAARSLQGLPGMGWMVELGVLLPVGISFFTFQTLSYSLDVYRGDREPEPHLGILALYISFFPQLVAGPIERSTRLLPQFHQRQRLDYQRVMSGLLTIIWGLFKKVVVADGLAPLVGRVYDAPESFHGVSILVASILFSFQIYCDFSGYSDIAIGAARVLGFDLMRNFDSPYFATTLSGFWRRWHVSLSTWFRDYVYIPLGGGRGGPLRFGRNIMIVFLLSGLWHGAKWTFVSWGLIHALVLLAERWWRSRRSRREGGVVEPAWRVRAWRGLGWAGTFLFVSYAWILFRAETLPRAGYMLLAVPRDLARWCVDLVLWRSVVDRVWSPLLMEGFLGVLVIPVAAVGFLVSVEVVGKLFPARAQRLLAHRWVRLLAMFVLIQMILLLGAFRETHAFIYFQF